MRIDSNKFFELYGYVMNKDVIPIRASTIALFEWCEIESFITFVLENSCQYDKELETEIVEILGKLDIAKMDGAIFHNQSGGRTCIDVLPIDKEKIDVSKIFTIINDKKPIVKLITVQYHTFQVQGVLDRIEQLEDGFRIVEIKTTTINKLSYFINHYKVIGSLQAGIYGWILTKNYGIKVSEIEVDIIDRATGEIIDSYRTKFDSDYIYRRIRSILNSYIERKLIGSSSKCGICRKRNPSLYYLCRSIFGDQDLGIKHTITWLHRMRKGQFKTLESYMKRSFLY